MDIKQSVDAFKEALITRFGDEIELYLFGSAARKDYGAESDIYFEEKDVEAWLQKAGKYIEVIEKYSVDKMKK